jgi:regulator of protease activity HflC (stomatin/prohibitin superfamily)
MEEVSRLGRGLSMKRIVMVVLIIVVLVAIVVPVTMLRTVDVGYVALLVDPLSRTVSEPIAGPAWFLKAPWVTDIRVYTAVDSVGMWKEDGLIGDFPPITPISSDGLRIEIDVLVRWSLDTTKLKALYERYPRLDWKENVISSVTREVARNIMGQYSAIEIIENRSVITQVLTTEIINSLTTEESLLNALQNVEVDLRDIDPPLEFIKAIESKLAAEQAQLQAEFEKQRIIILADASAAEQIIAAEGEATSRLILANGTAEAIRIIAETNLMNTTELTNLFLTLEALKVIAETTQNFIVVLGEGNLTYLIPTEQITP